MIKIQLQDQVDIPRHYLLQHPQNMKTLEEKSMTDLQLFKRL
jgi:hypothetical protein